MSSLRATRLLLLIACWAGCASERPRGDAPSTQATATSASHSSTNSAMVAVESARGPSAQPSASAAAPLPEDTAPISREVDESLGPIFWVHETSACRALGAKGPPNPLVLKPSTDTSNPRLPLPVVYRVMRNQIGKDLVACYAASSVGRECADARVTVHFKVARDGSSQLLEPVFQPKNPEFEACVASAVARVRFPEPEGGSVTFVLPIRFLR